MDIRLDEFVTLSVRAASLAEARGRAFAMAESFMPGHFVVSRGEMVEERREPDFSDLYEVTIWPAPVSL